MLRHYADLPKWWTISLSTAGEIADYENSKLIITKRHITKSLGNVPTVSLLTAEEEGFVLFCVTTHPLSIGWSRAPKAGRKVRHLTSRVDVGMRGGGNVNPVALWKAKSLQGESVWSSHLNKLLAQLNEVDSREPRLERATPPACSHRGSFRFGYPPLFTVDCPYPPLKPHQLLCVYRSNNTHTTGTAPAAAATARDAAALAEKGSGTRRLCLSSRRWAPDLPFFSPSHRPHLSQT